MNADEQQAALECVRQGDTQALGELLDSFRPYVRVLARALQNERLQGRLDESDLIQDALLEVYRSFASFHGETVAELTAWLRQVVIHTAGHTLRAHLGTARRDASREHEVDDLAGLAVDTGNTPSDTAIRHEQSARMAVALARLPEEMQQVLLGRHMDNLSHADLAGRLGRTEGAVRVLYTRALRRLRDECQT
jgi:RNA polymerase sigma-70 factor, ECF subfamily